MPWGERDARRTGQPRGSLRAVVDQYLDHLGLVFWIRVQLPTAQRRRACSDARSQAIERQCVEVDVQQTV